MVADIHDRMPLIIAPGDYARWLGDEPDPPRPDAAISGRAHARDAGQQV
jgi:putative SOS response-associated peptidase YedK